MQENVIFFHIENTGEDIQNIQLLKLKDKLLTFSHTNILLIPSEMLQNSVEDAVMLAGAYLLYIGVKH